MTGGLANHAHSRTIYEHDLNQSTPPIMALDTLPPATPSRTSSLRSASGSRRAGTVMMSSAAAPSRALTVNHSGKSSPAPASTALGSARKRSRVTFLRRGRVKRLLALGCRCLPLRKCPAPETTQGKSSSGLQPVQISPSTSLRGRSITDGVFTRSTATTAH